jgi:alpha-acetolactate decarboxylase
MSKEITYKFDHIGIPTKNSQKGEFYIEDGKCFCTDPVKTKFYVEYLRPEEGCPYPAVVLEKPHISYLVEDLDEALKGENVLIPPFQPIPTRRLAFIDVEGCLIELAEDVK